MRVRRSKENIGWKLLLCVVILAVTLLFGFEYLGREQEQKRVDQQISLPNTVEQTVK
jgi:predicted negative regulator of RcsB-dependent stress response